MNTLVDGYTSSGMFTVAFCDAFFNPCHFKVNAAHVMVCDRRIQTLKVKVRSFMKELYILAVAQCNKQCAITEPHREMFS